MPSDDVEGVACRLRGEAPMSSIAVPLFAGQFESNQNDVVIDEATSAVMVPVLRRLIKNCGASRGAVLDRAGQIVVWRGVDDGSGR